MVHGACLPRLTGSGDAVSPFGGDSDLQEGSSPSQTRTAGTSSGMSQGCPINVSPGLASEFCLVACHLAYLFPHFRFVPRLTPTPTPTPTQTQKTKRRGERARGRLALGFIPFLYALSFEDAVLLSASLFSLFFPSSVFSLRRLVFLVNQMFLRLALTPSHSSLIASAASLGLFRAFTVITI